MKKARIFISLLLAAMLVFSLSACGESGSADSSAQSAAASSSSSSKEAEPTAEPTVKPTAKPTAEPTAEPTPEPEKVFTPEGEYSLFGFSNEGILASVEALGTDSIISLYEGGTGHMTFGEDEIDVTKWTLDGTAFTIELSDGSAADGTIDKGILILDLFGNEEQVLYYSQEGADISGYDLLTAEEVQAALAEAAPDSLVAATMASIKSMPAVHINYDRHLDYMDSDNSEDVHIKDDVFYAFETTHVSGYDDTSATLFKDGIIYSLHPSDMTGITMEAPEVAALYEDVGVVDPLYAAIWKKAQSTDYVTEEGEVEGVSVIMEKFPATEYEAEATFCFDENGNLLYYIQGAPVDEDYAYMGGIFYKINAIDSEVNDAVFDVSGYTLSEADF